MTTATKEIKLHARLTFPGGADPDHMQAVSNLYNAVANMLYQERLAKECAVAIRRWVLENDALHPDDSVPMGMLHVGDETWAEFSDQIGGQGGTIDRLARGEWAARRVCRALAEACKNREVPLMDFIQAAIPEDWDDKTGLEYLLDVATWKPEQEDDDD